MRKHQAARAEKVRQRIKQESHESLRQAKRRLVKSASAESLADHVTPLGEAISNGKAAVPRKIRPGWRLLSFLLCGLLSLALFTAWRSPQYKVATVRVNGLQRLSEEEVLHAVVASGQQIFAVNPAEIHASVAASFPELWDIQVSVIMPNIVEVYVVERQPMIAWQTQNEVIWIDAEGYLIPARGRTDKLLTIQADTMPAYTLEIAEDETDVEKIILDKAGFKPNPSPLAFFAHPKRVDGNLLSAILQLNAWMPEEEILLYEQIHGLGWRDARGWDVYVGQKLENINEKMVMYETIVRELEKDDINPTLVSVEFLHAPFYRTE